MPRLRDRTQLADAEERLRQCAGQGGNIAGGSAGQVLKTHQNSSPVVRLVLPLRVIKEIDEKKYTARDDIVDRARWLIEAIRTQG